MGRWSQVTRRAAHAWRRQCRLLSYREWSRRIDMQCRRDCQRHRSLIDGHHAIGKNRRKVTDCECCVSHSASRQHSHMCMCSRMRIQPGLKMIVRVEQRGGGCATRSCRSRATPRATSRRAAPGDRDARPTPAPWLAHRCRAVMKRDATALAVIQLVFHRTDARYPPRLSVVVVGIDRCARAHMVGPHAGATSDEPGCDEA